MGAYSIGQREMGVQSQVQGQERVGATQIREYDPNICQMQALMLSRGRR